MTAIEVLSAAEINSIGIQILADQLAYDGWKITETKLDSAADEDPQIIGEKDGELAFFIVRTAILPNRGRFEGGQDAYENLVRLAKSNGATCYFASIGIARSSNGNQQKSSVDVEAETFDVQFDGLIRMELP
jgi:hypothetical protein